MNSRSRRREINFALERFTLLSAALAAGSLLQPIALGADPVAVLYSEGMVHGFLVLRSLEGKMLARGDLTQVAHGDRVTSRLVFHFRDGSLQDETVVYSQRHDFRLLSDHMVQKGPTFPQPMDVTADGTLKGCQPFPGAWTCLLPKRCQPFPRRS